jgi:hypothetical protein
MLRHVAAAIEQKRSPLASPKMTSRELQRPPKARILSLAAAMVAESYLTFVSSITSAP